MKKKIIVVILVSLCVVCKASADDCDIRASLVDLRDKGISFGVDYRAFISESELQLGDPCKMIAQSTGISAPRSSVFQQYRAATSGQNTFRRTFVIADPILLGQGALGFAKVKFNTTASGGAFYLLTLAISPGAPIPKGQTYSPNYLLSGKLDTVNQAGTVTNSQQAFNPQYVSNNQKFGIVWRKGNRPDPNYSWVNTTTLEISFGGNNSENIINYDLINSQYTGELDFKPESETRGVLFEQGLQAEQFRFKLGGNSLYE